MPRSISGPLAAHLAGTTTSLAMCWLLTRADGEVRRFTNHDRDVVVTGAGELNGTYEATAAFSTTSFTLTGDMSPSRTTVESLLKRVGDATISSGEIDVDDLRCGRYNNATIQVFLVNWRDISQGTLDLLKGNWGDIEIGTGSFSVEVRSLAERMRKKVVKPFAPDCRVDLFSSPCGLSPATFRESSFVEVVQSQLIFDLPAGESVLGRVTGEGEGVANSGVKWEPGTGAPAVLKLVKVTTTENGTPQFPFRVANAADLDSIRNNVFAYYMLVADIDMVAFGTWTPIPDFKGGLDGRGFVVSNLDSDLGASTTPNGLFQNTGRGSIIRRLGIEDSDFRGTNAGVDRGCFVGGPHAGLILDCYSFNNTLDGNNMGGIVGALQLPNGSGQVRGGSLNRCWAANIMGTGSAAANTNGLITNRFVTPGSEGVTIISCYGDREYSQDNGGVEINSTDGGIPSTDTKSQARTTAQMLSRATYVAAGSSGSAQSAPTSRFQAIAAAGFAWGLPWIIDDGNDYPRQVNMVT